MSPIGPLEARQALLRAISPDRLGIYQHAAAQAGYDVLDLYLWDRDTAAAALADIAILEVAMRNAMHTALADRRPPGLVRRGRRPGRPLSRSDHLRLEPDPRRSGHLGVWSRS